MQVELFPGVSTLLRAPDGSEISINDIKDVLQRQRAVVGSSPQSANQPCLSVAEELLVLQRLQQHQDYLRNSGLANAYVTGTDGFGATFGKDIGAWDLGVFQENLRRGVEQIVRSIRQNGDPRERLMKTEQSYGPSRSPSLYARQSENINRMVSVLQDVYFSLARLPSSPTPRSATSPAITSPGTYQALNVSSPTNTVANPPDNYGQSARYPLGMQQNFPSSRPTQSYLPMRSMSTSRAMIDVPYRPEESRSISHGVPSAPDSQSSEERRAKASFSEEAVLRTQQMTESLKPKTLTRMESNSGLKWTRSLTRRKSKKKLNRAISNPHLISTTQNLDNAIDLVNLPQSPAPGPGDPSNRSSHQSGSSHNTTTRTSTNEKAQPSPGLGAMRSSPHQSLTKDGVPLHPAPVQNLGPGVTSGISPRVSNSSNQSRLVSPMQNMQVNEASLNRSEPSEITFGSSEEAIRPTPQFENPQPAPNVTYTTPAAGAQSVPRAQQVFAATPGGGAGLSSPSTLEQRSQASNPAIRKSLLVNMGIQLPSPRMPTHNLPETEPSFPPNASPVIPTYPNPPATQFANQTAPGSSPSLNPNNTSPAMPISSYVPGLGAVQSPSLGHSPEASFFSTKSFGDASVPPMRDVQPAGQSPALGSTLPTDPHQSFAASKIRESQAGEVITFPSENDLDDQSVDTHTEHDKPQPAQVPSVSTPPRRTNNNNSLKGANVTPSSARKSYGDSVYDMYLGKSGTDKSGTDIETLFKKTGLPPPREDDFRDSRILPSTRPGTNRSLFGDTGASPRIGRTDNPVWQVIAGLNDRSSVYSDLESRRSKRFSDLSEVSRTDERGNEMDSRALADREAENESHRTLFKEARTVQPSLPVFADFDSIVMPDDSRTPTQMSPASARTRHSSSRVPSTLESAPIPLSAPVVTETNDRGMPVQVVYYNDDELPQIMDQIAQGNSSARIEFRRRSALPPGQPVPPLTTVQETQGDDVPDLAEGAEEATGDEQASKAEEDSQLAKVEQSILSLLRPTFASLKTFS